MAYFIFIFKSALEDFRRNKVRTFLTSLGILIGVSSVVLLISLGLGLKQYIKNQFESLGTNLIMLMPGEMIEGGSFSSSAGGFGGIRFDEKDILTVKKVKNTTYVVPVYSKSVTVEGAGKSEIGTLYATTADIFPVRNLEVEYGRLFDKNDVDKRSKKIVIGPKLAEKIFGSKGDALGKTIKIEKQAFPVGGILKSKGGGGFGGPDFDTFVYMPYKSALAFNPEKEFYTVLLKANSEENIPQVKADIKTALLKRYKEDEFSVVEQKEIIDAISSIFTVLNTGLVGIAAISLLVGGIGIMNIMYVSVIERTREIGIRRAIGATGRDVLTQFILEAVILSLIGGLLGLSLAFLVILIIHPFFPAYADQTAVAVALGVSSGIGIIFGVFPAKRASDLSPIEAIRYE